MSARRSLGVELAGRDLDPDSTERFHNFLMVEIDYGETWSADNNASVVLLTPLALMEITVPVLCSSCSM